MDNTFPHKSTTASRKTHLEILNGTQDNGENEKSSTATAAELRSHCCSALFSAPAPHLELTFGGTGSPRTFHHCRQLFLEEELDFTSICPNMAKTHKTFPELSEGYSRPRQHKQSGQGEPMRAPPALYRARILETCHLCSSATTEMLIAGKASERRRRLQSSFTFRCESADFAVQS